MTAVNRPLDATDLTASLLGPPSAVPLSGDIVVRSRLDFTSEDRQVVSGIWESEPGTSRWEFTTRGEIIHVIEGRLVVVEDGGEPTEVTAGSTAYFPIGWRGEWTVHERLRKVYVVFKA